MTDRPPAPFYVCGPTASGKSALALQFALQLDGEIINADAFQLYSGIDVLSAAPSAEEKAQIPHHLYSQFDPKTAINAGDYRSLALRAITEVQARGKTPIITGGSGLYLKFLTHGPAPLPLANASLRSELDALPLAELVSQLTALDPLEASRTSLVNRRFVSRALEICLLSGNKASDLRDGWALKTANITSTLRGIMIQRSRSDLHDRIAQRTRAMLQNGALAEVACLSQVSANCEKAIGFREIRAFLSEEIDRPHCEDLINAATRQYAKRQETWFRRETWLQIHRMP